MSQSAVRTEPSPGAEIERQQHAAALVALAESGEALRDLALALNMRPDQRTLRFSQVAMGFERAAGRLRRGVLTDALRSDAATDPEAALRQAAYEMHVAAEAPAVLAGIAALREAASQAMMQFRRYEAHHRAKPDEEKAERNAALATKLEAALFPRISEEPEMKAGLAVAIRALAAGDSRIISVAELNIVKELAVFHDLRGMADFIGGLIDRKLGDA